MKLLLLCLTALVLLLAAGYILFSDSLSPDETFKASNHSQAYRVVAESHMTIDGVLASHEVIEVHHSPPHSWIVRRLDNGDQISERIVIGKDQWLKTGEVWQLTKLQDQLSLTSLLGGISSVLEKKFKVAETAEGPKVNNERTRVLHYTDTGFGRTASAELRASNQARLPVLMEEVDKIASQLQDSVIVIEIIQGSDSFNGIIEGPRVRGTLSFKFDYSSPVVIEAPR